MTIVLTPQQRERLAARVREDACVETLEEGHFVIDSFDTPTAFTAEIAANSSQITASAVLSSSLAAQVSMSAFVAGE